MASNPAVALEARTRMLNHCFRQVISRLLQSKELAAAWQKHQDANASKHLEIEIIHGDVRQYTEARQRIPKAYIPFVDAVDKAIETDAIAAIFRRLRNGLQEDYPGFRIGILVSSAAKLVPAPSAPVPVKMGGKNPWEPTANDRRFLRSMRISADGDDGTIE